MFLRPVARAPSPSRSPLLSSRPPESSAPDSSISRTPPLMRWRTTPCGLACRWVSPLPKALGWGAYRSQVAETTAGSVRARIARPTASRWFVPAHGLLMAALAFPVATLAAEPAPDPVPRVLEALAAPEPLPRPTVPPAAPHESIAAEEKESTPAERFSLHYQATVATQWHPSFSARYSGQNSMRPEAESATSVLMDLFTGGRLWRGAELYFQPELAGGRGLSSTLGVAAFPSGEVYRVGDPTPTLVVGRAFLRQVIGLGGGTLNVDPGPNQLAGRHDRDALTLTIGKIATTDIVDNDPLSNDPHTRFTSWGLWSSVAYDYPADTRGYTWGVAANLSVDWWSARGGIFLEPTTANGMEMEWRVDKARGLALEGEARFSLGGQAGAVRALAFLNEAHMGSYRQAIAEGVNVSATRADGRTKYGFAASINQQVDDTLGFFVRLSYNDGANETWAFTEIDRALAAGAVQGGARWGRPQDEAGAAVVVSGLSDAHRAYLAAGGYGFIIGDGALRYGHEVVGEVYYRLGLTKEASLIGTYQPVINPAFNEDRGTIHIFTGRVHVAF
jgi:high affinity Mn2+ porin